MTLSVSVVLATHNRPDLAEGTVLSLLRQTLLPDEIIVIDDGWENLPADLAGKVESSGVAFRYARRSPPSLPASRNRGIDLAGGEIVVFAEDDLTMPDDYLQRLVEMYRADGRSVVFAIGGVVEDSGWQRPARRIWRAISDALGLNRWAPRVCAARYVPLPAALKGRIVPTRWISGGAISLRRSACENERFEEAFSGYAHAEDIEFCFRTGRRKAIFLAPELRLFHEPSPKGRRGMRDRGRIYVENLLHIARRSVEDGVGTRVLLYYYLLGTIGMCAIWSLLARRRANVEFAIGMSSGLLRYWIGSARRELCGS